MGLKEVLELIVNITQNASKCEENKQKLNDHYTFEPYALFSRIDRDDKKFITKEDLIAFLADNNITIDINRLTPLLSNLHFTTPHMGNLRLKVFMQEFEKCLFICPDYNYFLNIK